MLILKKENKVSDSDVRNSLIEELLINARIEQKEKIKRLVINSNSIKQVEQTLEVSA